jgi:UDP-glucuronate decarboxylase
MTDINKDINQIVSHTKDISHFFDGKHFLITGAAGFLGSWLAESLLVMGGQITGIDNLASGTMDNVNYLKSIGKDRFTFLNHDISQPIDYASSVDYVMHLASRASPFEFVPYPIQIMKSNTLGTMNALGIAKRHGARFLFTSTSETYGEAQVFPTPETYRGNVNALGIRGCYDEAKRAGEALCMAYFRQHAVDVRIARIFNTYGSRMRADGLYGRVIPRFMEQAMTGQPITIFGDGSQTRSFCYVTDQIEGLLRMCTAPAARGEVVNIGNPTEITIRELADLIIRLTDSESSLTFEPMPPDDPTRRVPDIQKARDLLGWNPRVTLEDGLCRIKDNMQNIK